MTSHINRSVTVPASQSGSRFDVIAAELFPDYSRSKIKEWIKSGALTADGRELKANSKLSGGERLHLSAELEPNHIWEAQDLPLDAVYEDDHIIVIDKPRNLVVHPAAGNWQGTLLNALLFHYPELRELPRAGIVHRLDKDTSGLMVVARNLPAQTSLVEQLQARSVTRIYQAIVHGTPSPKNGEIEAPIGRHPSVRTKMSVVEKGGKPALTRYKVLEEFSGFSLVELSLATGRTHQIRVHMSHIGCPLVGDPVYGRAVSKTQLKNDSSMQAAHDFERQALHAVRLEIKHPETDQSLSWQSALADDIQSLIRKLQQEENA